MPFHIFGHHARLRKQRMIHWFDHVIVFVGLLSPIMTLPQIWVLYTTQTSAGVSLISWITYLIVACFWLVYGLIHKEFAIIWTYIGTVLVNAIVVYQVILYG